MQSVSPVWLVLIAIASVQFGAAFAKLLFGVIDPTTVVWLRLGFSALILALVARPPVRGKSARDWIVVLGYGACLAGMNWSIYQSFSRIPIGLAVTLEFLGPLAVSVFGSRRLRDLAWVALAAIGVFLLGAVPSDPDWVGMGFALVAGSCWAGYILLAGPTGRRWPGVSGLTIASVLGATVLAVPGIVAGGAAMWTPAVLGIGLAVAVLSSVVPYGLELQALRRIKTRTFGVLMSLEPAAAALAALIVLREWLTWTEWIAIGCVVVASIGATRSARGEDATGVETPSAQ